MFTFSSLIVFGVVIVVLVGGIVSQPSTNTLVFNEEYALLLSNALGEIPGISDTNFVTLRSDAPFRSYFFPSDTLYVRFACGLTYHVQHVQVVTETDSSVEELLQFDSVISLISSEVWPIEIFTSYTSVYFKDGKAAKNAQIQAGYGSPDTVQPPQLAYEYHCRPIVAYATSGGAFLVCVVMMVCWLCSDKKQLTNSQSHSEKDVEAQIEMPSVSNTQTIQTSPLHVNEVAVPRYIMVTNFYNNYSEC